VAEYLETLWATGHSPATIAAIRSCLRAFVAFAPSDDLEAAAARIIPFLAARASKVRRNSLCAYFSTLKMWLAWAVRKGYIDRSPLDGLKAPKQEQIVTPPLTDTEILALYQGAGMWERAMLVLLLSTGMRLGELVDLRWDDIRGTEATVHGKGAKQRVLALGEAALGALRELPQKGPFVFPMGHSAIRYRLDKLGERTGVAYHPHQIRHTFAHALARSGISTEILSELLGHSSLQTTAIYLRAFRRERALASQRDHNPADRLFGRGPTMPVASRLR
jgi:integrase/recombinase XerC